MEIQEKKYYNVIMSETELKDIVKAGYDCNKMYFDTNEELDTHNLNLIKTMAKMLENSDYWLERIQRLYEEYDLS